MQILFRNRVLWGELWGRIENDGWLRLLGQSQWSVEWLAGDLPQNRLITTSQTLGLFRSRKFDHQRGAVLF